MSPLLLHSNTNQHNINGLLIVLTPQPCCNHILSAAVLTLFYSLQRVGGSNGFIAEKTIPLLYKRSRGGPLFSRGGVFPIFLGGGPNAYF